MNIFGNSLVDKASHIFSYGGYNGKKTLGLFKLNNFTDSFEKVIPINLLEPLPRMFSGVTTIGPDSIWINGGTSRLDGSCIFEDVWRYNITENTWFQIMGSTSCKEFTRASGVNIPTFMLSLFTFLSVTGVYFLTCEAIKRRNIYHRETPLLYANNNDNDNDNIEIT